VPIFGGGGKWEMAKALKEGCELVVATPGRMIEMVKARRHRRRRHLAPLFVDD
jgi:ATP-dependent RNA helicase DDX42